MSVKRICWNGTKVEFSKWFMHPNYTEDIFNFLSKKFIVGICGHSVDRQLFLNGCNVSILGKKGTISSSPSPYICESFQRCPHKESTTIWLRT